MRLAMLAVLALAVVPAGALAQSEYKPPTKVNADEIAISFIAGRYASPVTCKLADGSQVEGIRVWRKNLDGVETKAGG